MSLLSVVSKVSLITTRNITDVVVRVGRQRKRKPKFFSLQK